MILNAHNGAADAVKAVYLNGKYMHNVIRADDVVGEVTFTTDAGRAAYLMITGDKVPETTDTGHVQIELHSGWGYDAHLRRFIMVRPD